jgi:hypothetical protein
MRSTESSASTTNAMDASSLRSSWCRERGLGVCVESDNAMSAETMGSQLVAAIMAWEGAELIPTLLDGYVLIALPAWVARGSSVVGLGAGLGLLLLVFRLADRSGDSPAGSEEEREGQGDSAWELA